MGSYQIRLILAIRRLDRINDSLRASLLYLRTLERAAAALRNVNHLGSNSNSKMGRKMNFKLDKSQISERDNLIDELRERGQKLQDAVIAYNDVMEEQKDTLIQLLNEYNGIMEEARTFAATVAGNAQEAYDEKSDNWKESENGEKVNSFIEDWENADLFDHEIEFPDPIDPELPDHADTLENLPEE